MGKAITRDGEGKGKVYRPLHVRSPPTVQPWSRLGLDSVRTADAISTVLLRRRCILGVKKSVEDS